MENKTIKQHYNKYLKKICESKGIRLELEKILFAAEG